MYYLNVYEKVLNIHYPLIDKYNLKKEKIKKKSKYIYYNEIPH